MIYTTHRIKDLGTTTSIEALLIPVVNKKLPQSLPKNLQLELKKHPGISDSLEGSNNWIYLNKPEGLAKRIFFYSLPKGQLTIKQIKASLKNIKVVVSGYSSCGVILPEGSEKIICGTITQILEETAYQFTELRTKEPTTKILLSEISIFTNKKITETLEEAKVLSQVSNLIKTLAHRPASHLTPEHFAAESISAAREAGLFYKVLEKEELEKLGMGGLLGVGQGSPNQPRLIILEHKTKSKKTVALAGKGITFDSGGISIKPAKDMHEMKYDMLGGATVLGVMIAAAKLKLPINLVGVIAAAENLPSGTALKPGDVVKTFSGQTIEVLNTDAEGRIVLADALWYAVTKYKPNLIIDLATLTGAVVVALGNKITGAFGNNQTMNELFQASTISSGEDTHFLPLYNEYESDLSSTVADFANIGKMRTDAIIAAVFLSKFIPNNTPWIHLDIAGTAWNNEGPTAVMVSSLINFLSKLSRGKNS